MRPTGWVGGGEEPEAAPMPLTRLALAAKQRVPGGVVGQAMARSAAAEARDARAAADTVRDPDEYASALVNSGYLPGAISQLSMRLADVEAELADEVDKIGRAARRAERVQRDHAAGRISVADIARMQADTDEGDPGTVEKLQRRADSLRRQIREAAEASMPREAREMDAVAEAGRRAQSIMAAVAQARAEEDAAARQARAKMTADRAKFYAARGGLPFVSSGGAGLDEWRP